MRLMCWMITAQMTMRLAEVRKRRNVECQQQQWSLGGWSVNWTPNLRMKSCLYLNISAAVNVPNKILFCDPGMW